MEFILFHIPSGMFSDQTHIDESGVIHTCGLSFRKKAEAEAERLSLANIGCNPAEWKVLVKPDNVVTDWIV